MYSILWSKCNIYIHVIKIVPTHTSSTTNNTLGTVTDEYLASICSSKHHFTALRMGLL